MKLQVSFYLIFIIYRLLAITSILLALLLFLIIIHLIIFGRIDAPEFEYSENSSGLTPEEQELLNHFLNI